MNPLVAFVGLTIVVPLLLSWAIVTVGNRCLSEDHAGRMAVPLAFAAAFAAGSALLPAPLIPERHWHWLPLIGWLAALAGAATSYKSSRRRYTLPILIVLAGIAAWCLVPTWDTLRPQRRVLVPVFALCLFTLTVLLQRLRPQLNNRSLVALMVGTSLAIGLLTAGFVSFNYAKLALIASSALIGCGLTTPLTQQVLSVRALTPAYVHVLGGCALVSAIEPTEPLYPFVLLPWIPWLASAAVLGASTGAVVGRASMTRWLVALTAMGLTAFLMHASTQVPTRAPDPPVEDESMNFDEEYFQ